VKSEGRNEIDRLGNRKRISRIRDVLQQPSLHEQSKAKGVRRIRRFIVYSSSQRPPSVLNILLRIAPIHPPIPTPSPPINVVAGIGVGIVARRWRSRIPANLLSIVDQPFLAPFAIPARDEFPLDLCARAFKPWPHIRHSLVQALYPVTMAASPPKCGEPTCTTTKSGGSGSESGSGRGGVRKGFHTRTRELHTLRSSSPRWGNRQVSPTRLMQAPTPPQPCSRGTDPPSSTCITTSLWPAGVCVCARARTRPVVILVLFTSAVAKPPILTLHSPPYSSTPYPPRSIRTGRRTSLLTRGGTPTTCLDYLPCPQFIEAHLALQLCTLGGKQPLFDEGADGKRHGRFGRFRWRTDSVCICCWNSTCLLGCMSWRRKDAQFAGR